MRLKAGITLALAIGTLATSTSAWAAPASTDTTTVEARQLGASNQIQVNGSGLPQRVVMSVPKGLKPVSIHADWQRTPEVTAGALIISQDGRSIATADVSTAPLVADGVTIPLRNPQINNNTFTFDLAVRPSGDRAVCSPLLEAGSVTLSTTSLVFEGDDTPKTVSDFFPAALQHLNIYTPANPTPGQSEAAFDITTTVIRDFALDAADVHVKTGTPAPVGTLERNVVLDPTAPAGITQDGRTLKLGGDDPTIIKNAAALATNARPLSQTAQVATETANPTPIADHDRYSFAQLGIDGLNMDGIGRVERSIALSQANVGGPAHNWSFRVVGAYEPQHDTANATFSILTNGTLLRSVLLDKSGLLDVSVNLPDSLAGRNPSLTFRFDTNPADTSCAAANPFSASISANSSVDIERGNGATSQGFTRWPQVALPKLNVAFDSITPDSLGAALETVATLQATTTTPIAVSVAPTLNDQTPAPLFAVVTKTTVPDYLHAPLPGPGVKLTGDKGETLVSLHTNEELSSLQAYELGAKDVLVLAGPSAKALGTLADTLGSQKNGWFALNGDTWFQAGDHEPEAIQARGGSLKVQPVAPATSTVLQRHRALFIIGAVILMIAVLGLLYPRMVQDRPVGGEHEGGRRSTDPPARPEQ